MRNAPLSQPRTLGLVGEAAPNTRESVMSQCSILQVGHGPVDPSPEVVEQHDRVEVVGHLAGLGQGSYLGGLLAVGVHLPGDHLAQGLRPSSATSFDTVKQARASLAAWHTYRYWTRVPELRFATPVSQAAGAPSPRSSNWSSSFRISSPSTAAASTTLRSVPAAPSTDETTGVSAKLPLRIIPGHLPGKGLSQDCPTLHEPRTRLPAGS